ncbi:TetR-like C-terminal domain-containing protein, partial [Kitasatospora sp. NPDC003701]
VAVERLRPDAPPADLGSLRADLAAWAVQFAEEMSSAAGRTYVRDALLGDPEQGNAVRCSDYAAEQLKAIGVRAAGRGEAVPDLERLLDVVVAPLMYRILFRPSDLSEAYTDQLVAAAVGRAAPLA